ncbi:MAG: hypothetical protein ACREPI_10270 [Candidatus Dormibacterales bacterium]
MEEIIIRVLTGEVQRRHCPGCGFSLRAADVAAAFEGADRVRLRFRCGVCVFEGGGEIELTPEIYREAAQISPEPVPGEPISGDEVISVHEILSGWRGGLAELVAPAG